MYRNRYKSVSKQVQVYIDYQGVMYFWLNLSQNWLNLSHASIDYQRVVIDSLYVFLNLKINYMENKCTIPLKRLSTFDWDDFLNSMHLTDEEFEQLFLEEMF